MKDGEVVEDPEDDLETPKDDVETTEDDVETGTKICCGWCLPTEEQQTGHSVAITASNEVSGDVLVQCFSSSENPAKVYDDEHLSKIDEDDVAGVDLPDNLHKAAAAALVTSDREEKYPDTDTEMVLAMTIRQSEKEAVDIVTELIDNIITDIL